MNRTGPVGIAFRIFNRRNDIQIPCFSHQCAWLNKHDEVCDLFRPLHQCVGGPALSDPGVGVTDDRNQDVQED
jgi:hypothetical protein